MQLMLGQLSKVLHIHFPEQSRYLSLTFHDLVSFTLHFQFAILPCVCPILSFLWLCALPLALEYLFLPLNLTFSL